MEEENVNQILQNIDAILNEYAEGARGKELYAIEYLKASIKGMIRQNLQSKNIKAGDDE